MKYHHCQTWVIVLTYNMWHFSMTITERLWRHPLVISFQRRWRLQAVLFNVTSQSFTILSLECSLTKHMITPIFSVHPLSPSMGYYWYIYSLPLFPDCKMNSPPLFLTATVFFHLAIGSKCLTYVNKHMLVCIKPIEYIYVYINLIFYVVSRLNCQIIIANCIKDPSISCKCLKPVLEFFPGTIFRSACVVKGQVIGIYFFW